MELYHQHGASEQFHLIDLAPRYRLASHLANTIGGLILNEILETARCLSRLERYRSIQKRCEMQIVGRNR